MNTEQQTTSTAPTSSTAALHPSEIWTLYQLLLGRSVPPDSADLLIQRQPQLAARARFDRPCVLDGKLTSDIVVLTDDGVREAHERLQADLRGPGARTLPPVERQSFAFALMAEIYRLCGSAPADRRPFVRVQKGLVLVQHGVEVCYVCNPDLTLAELRKLPDNAGITAFWDCL